MGSTRDDAVANEILRQLVDDGGSSAVERSGLSSTRLGLSGSGCSRGLQNTRCLGSMTERRWLWRRRAGSPRGARGPNAAQNRSPYKTERPLTRLFRWR